MNVFKLAFGALFAVTLAGCAQDVVSPYTYYGKAGLPQLFQYAAADRDFRTVIYGNPSPAPKQAFDATVVAAMQGRNWGPTTNFTTSPAEGARKDYRVVMVFSGDRYVGGDAACRDIDLDALAPASDRVRLQASFCYRDQLLSQTHVDFAGIRELNDPTLDRAVSQAVVLLFPLRDPYLDPDHDRNVVVP